MTLPTLNAGKATPRDNSRDSSTAPQYICPRCYPRFGGLTRHCVHGLDVVHKFFVGRIFYQLSGDVIDKCEGFSKLVSLNLECRFRGVCLWLRGHIVSLSRSWYLHCSHKYHRYQQARHWFALRSFGIFDLPF